MIRARRPVKIGAGQTADVNMIPLVHLADGIATVTFPNVAGFSGLTVVLDEPTLVDLLEKVRVTKQPKPEPEKTDGK